MNAKPSENAEKKGLGQRLAEALAIHGGSGAAKGLSGKAIGKIAAELGMAPREAMILLLERGVWPERFVRNQPVFTNDEQIKALRLRPLIVGCGGLGGHVAAMLARIGAGFLRLCDPDCFEESNLNRQMFCLESSLGKPKALAVRDGLLAIASHMEIEAIETAATPENLPEMLKAIDIAIDCLDSVPRKKMLAKACAKAGVPCLHGSVLGQEGIFCLDMPPDSSLEKLYPDFAAANERSAAMNVLAHTVDGTAALMVGLLTNQFILSSPKATPLYHADIGAPLIEAFSLS